MVVMVPARRSRCGRSIACTFDPHWERRNSCSACRTKWTSILIYTTSVRGVVLAIVGWVLFALVVNECRRRRGSAGVTIVLGGNDSRRGWRTCSCSSTGKARVVRRVLVHRRWLAGIGRCFLPRLLLLLLVQEEPETG